MSDIEDLWWVMHHSDDETLEAAAVTCYLDESGTDDLSPTAVVGGVVTDKPRFIKFQGAWETLLKRHGVPFIHMKEFGPHGKLGYLTVQQRRALFADAVAVINEHKIISIAATLTTAEYDQHLSAIFDRKIMGVYGACFMLCAFMNHLVAKQQKYEKQVAFILDEGNTYAEHVRKAHRAMRSFQKRQPLNVGGLTFEDEEKVLILQAADIVVWAVRRKIIGTLPPGFESLDGLFVEQSDRHHVQMPFSEQLLTMLAESLGKTFPSTSV